MPIQNILSLSHNLPVILRKEIFYSHNKISARITSSCFDVVLARDDFFLLYVEVFKTKSAFFETLCGFRAISSSNFMHINRFRVLVRVSNLENPHTASLFEQREFDAVCGFC